MEMRPLDLAGLLRARLESLGPQAEVSGKKLFCEITDSVPWILGDERWLSLVLDNLISNALKFSKPGGRVDVSLADKGDFVMVCVADDGVGIPLEDHEHIFEKFYRARNAQKTGAPGTGLGLAISREIVVKHGGKIWFDSESGHGTKFYFVLTAVHDRETVA